MKEGGAFGGAKTILHSEDSHESVVGNVKNVQGWRGGAERGFLGSYTDIIHQICSNQQFPELSEWYTKVSLSTWQVKWLTLDNYQMALAYIDLYYHCRFLPKI